MKKIFWILVFLTLFAFSVRVYRFTEPNHYYFDEVYHAVTAEGYAENNKNAYDPFAPPPKKDTAYDWLHPPLAKLIQAASIKTFGDSPFAWRLPSVIFGTAIIPATFILAYLLFGPTVAVFAAAVISLENLTLVMSRITMNDVFVTFFILMSFVFFKLYARDRKLKNLVLTSIFLGLAISSKWTGFYALGIIFVFSIFLGLKEKRLRFSNIVIIIIPVIIYLLSFSQYWLQGYTFTDFINLNKQIWWYQNRHDLEHPYGTTPLYCVPHGLEKEKTFCPWVLDARGVYFSYEQYGAKAGYIYALGNPLVFWGGVLSVSYLLGQMIENRSFNYLLVAGGYFVFWFPWIFSPRIMFLYHYLPSIPFMAIIIGFCLGNIYKTKYKVISLIVLLSFALMFFYLFPISTGFPIGISDIDKFMLLKTWR